MADRVGQPPHNLPAQVTPLIGREHDVANACALLHRAEVRLVTLTGAGGIGKTRLGIEIAHCQLGTFADGVCFVPLAPISDPILVVAAIAQALEIKEVREQPFLDLLKVFLQGKHLLLILDNFEQVVTAAPLLSELLATCPRLKILVTSRAVLHIQGEHEFPVPPLALPDLTRLPAGKDLAQYPAVALFLQRARAIKPDLAITEAGLRAIAEICARLDGLPLAIELAAVRIKLLPPQVLLQRLERRLPLLTGGVQDVPARQRTLRNAIAWSYQLLNEEEQRLFRRLCIFVGGCTLEAIEFVCGTLGDADLPVLEGVTSLIDNSLLQQAEQEEEERADLRLVMLETIREYGLEALVEQKEMEAMRQAHAAYYLSMAEQAESELGGPRQAGWLKRLEREHDNLRAALQWSLEPGAPRPALEMGLRLGGALRRFWLVHGHWREGQSYLERALRASEEGIAAPVQAKALIAAANIAVNQSDYDRAEALCQEGLALYRQLGDQAGIAYSLYLLAWTARDRDDFAAARSFTEEALVFFRAIGDKERVIWSLFSLAALDAIMGEYARARALFEESLVMNRKLGNKLGLAWSLNTLARVHLEAQDDPTVIRSLLEESLVLWRELEDPRGTAYAVWLSGQVALCQDDIDTARSSAEESVRLYKEIGDQLGTTEALILLARVVACQGDDRTARGLYEEGLKVAVGTNHKWVIASSLEGLASIVAGQGQFAWAARLWGSAESLREAIGVPIPLVERAGYERAVAAARAGLGEKAFAARWSEGSTGPLEEALVAQGTEVVPPPLSAVSVPIIYPARLTVREVEVLRLVAKGLTNSQIAQELELSEKTVATHLTHIFNKTNSENRAAAAAFAIHHRLF